MQSRDGKNTRNPTQMGQVHPIPDKYWVGYGISFRNFHGYGIKRYPTRLPETTYPFTRNDIPDHLPKFFNFYFYFPLTLVY
ncbi:hypothetical protein Hanom_Chr15g01402221 [Helianthus anomalus]